MITVRSKVPYQIHIARGLKHKATAAARRLGKVVLITDTNVAALCSDMLKDVLLVKFPAGEKSKTRRTKERIEDEMLSSGIERDSCVLAVGGGVVGDMAGFVAATYHRGIPIIQVPTTLLAMVDSSVGGKTGVDTQHGKNMIGAFHNPSEVFIDLDFLGSLPDREFRAGLAEVVKYAVAFDADMFYQLEKYSREILSRDSDMLADIIGRCCRIKASVVEEDERDEGARGKLNLGHTIGHAVEQAEQYRIRHGEAVSIGIAHELGISVSRGRIEASDAKRIMSLLEALGLPVRTVLKPGELLPFMKHDKKNKGGDIRMALAEGIGKSGLPVAVSEKEIMEALR